MNKEENVRSFFEEDHNRLDSLFREFQELKQNNLSKAIETFREFKIGLQRHIVWEEQIMFPLFRKKMSGNGEEVVDQMKKEHRKIKKFLENIHDSLKKRNVETDQDEESLLSVLQTHNEKEESIVYPSMETDLTEEEKKEVFEKMDSIPEEEYHHCCEAEED